MATIEKRKLKTRTTYRVKVRLNGTTETASFDKLTDAKRWGQEVEAAIRLNKHFKSDSAKKYSVSDMIEKYRSEILPTVPSGKNKEAQLTWWKEQLGHIKLINLSTPMVSQCKDKLLKEVISGDNATRSISTVLRYLATFSNVIEIAIREWEWMRDNPFGKLKKLKASPSRIRCLSDEERANLLQACEANNMLYTIVVLALSTGMRKQEILTLTWDDIDLIRGRAVLQKTKNGDKRGIPLTGRAMELIRGLSKVRSLRTNLLFPCKDFMDSLDIRTPWRKALKEAGIEDFHFHDLRHSAASYLAMNGATLNEIAEVLGHKSIQMSKRYVHFAETHTTKVVESMNQRLFG